MQRHLTDALRGDEHELVLDFTGVQGMAPSFFGEMLSMIQETSRTEWGTPTHRQGYEPPDPADV